GEITRDSGAVALTREDEAYLVGAETAKRAGIPEEQVKVLVSGEDMRDWRLFRPTAALFPYEEDGFAAFAPPALSKFLWPWKKQLGIRVAFGKTQLERGQQ